MATTSFDQFYTSDTSISVPDNASNLRVTITGARGGAGYQGGSRGGGRTGQFRYNDDWLGITMNLYPGQNGTDATNFQGAPGGQSPFGDGGNGGQGSQPFSFTVPQTCREGIGYRRNNGGACGCPPGDWYCNGQQGNGDPCCGGAQLTPNECFCCFRDYDCTYTVNGVNYYGGGGGGGSAVGFSDSLYGNVAVAGGGGGGRGYNGSTPGANASDWSAGSISLQNGGNGSNGGSNGGTGGGGAGSPAASVGSNSSGSVYNSSAVSLIGGNGTQNSLNPRIRVEYTLNTPTIDSFSASPASLDGDTGVPEYNSTLFWSVSDFERTNLSGPGVNYDSTAGSDSYGVTLPQSTAGSNSPVCQTYTLTAYAGSTTTTSSVEICATNDNTPNNISVSGNAFPWAAPGPAITAALEPESEYYVEVFYNGTDMNTLAVSSTPGILVTNSIASPVLWTTSKLIAPGENLYIRFDTLPFNTDTTPGGTNANGETIGQTNSKTVSIDFGTETVSFTATTRAPVIEEFFNFEGINPPPTGTFPDPDIDTNTIDDPEFIRTGGQTMNDIEIDVEIRTNNEDAQVEINGDGNWLDMRSIP